MPEPNVEFADAIRIAADADDVDVNVQPAPVSQIEAPLILVRPDDPWMLLAPDDHPMTRYAEQYVALCIVPSGDPLSAVATLRELAQLARDTADAIGWAWRETSGVTPFQDSGVDYLGVIVSVTTYTKE